MNRFVSKITHRLDAGTFRAVLVWTVWLTPLAWLNAQYAGETPSWKQGVSTWNGAGYAPAAALAGPPPTFNPAANGVAPVASTMTESPKPYTVPIDPSLSTNPVLAAPIEPVAYPAPTSNNVPAFDLTVAEVPASSVVAAVAQAPPTEPSSVELAGHRHQGAITQQMEAGVVVDEPPLREQTIVWYQRPWYWMTRGWNNHAEFGLDGSRGNAETLAMQVGAEMTRKTDWYTLAFDVDYRFANSRKVTTEDNGRFNVDYDRILNKSPWSLFSKLGLEFDAFKAFDLRLNLNGGIGYYWIRSKQTTFVSRFGAGASREFGAPIDEWTPEAVFGLEGERQLNKYNKFKAKVDYFPAWEDFSDYRVVTDAGWEILLDDTDNLSLKLAVTDRYDSTPQGAQKNDFYYSMLLLFKF